MKKNLRFLPAMFAFLAFAACSKDDDSGTEPTPEPEPAVVAIESFGFYQEDNEDILFADYVVNDISGTTIDVPLPAEAEVSSLVARFTTTEGDKVSVQGVTQLSGETANDFSAPLEYLVSEEDTNVIYVVSVSKMASAVWSQLPTFASDSITYLALDIHPQNYQPYIAFISDREEDADEKLNLIGYGDNGWDLVGSKDFSPGRARSVDLAFSAEGTPFVAFGDDSGEQTEAAIMSYESNSWGYLGAGPFTGGLRSSVTSVTVAEDGEVYGFFINDQLRHADRRGVTLKTFNGAWNDNVVTGRAGYARILRSEQVNGDIYLGVLDFSNGQAVSVYKYSNGTWTTLADKMKEEETVLNVYDFSMDVDADGNVYVAFVQSGADTPFQHKVMKYAAAEETWSNVGDIVHSTTSSLTIRSFAVAVDNYGNPMLFYRNENENPVVTHFDPDTNNWGATNVLGSVAADELKLEVAPDGIAYASYIVGNKLFVHKFDSPDNN